MHKLFLQLWSGPSKWLGWQALILGQCRIVCCVTGLGSIHPRAGELTHTGGTVPESQREVVFGNSSALDFAGLGLANSLASYLEGSALPIKHLQMSKIWCCLSGCRASLSYGPVAALNFTNPTRIQQQAIPALLV